jgi:hypothetical protein
MTDIVAVVVIGFPRRVHRARPGVGSGLSGVGLVGDPQGSDAGTVGTVPDDGEQVALAESAGGCGDADRGIDRPGSD